MMSHHTLRTVPIMLDLVNLIVLDTNPDGTPEEHSAAKDVLIRTFITDYDAYYSALLKYFPEDCI